MLETQPMILSISTAGYVNDSIYDDPMLRSTSFLNGSSEETNVRPFLYMIDDIELWDNIEEFKEKSKSKSRSISFKRISSRRNQNCQRFTIKTRRVYH